MGDRMRTQNAMQIHKSCVVDGFALLIFGRACMCVCAIDDKMHEDHKWTSLIVFHRFLSQQTFSCCKQFLLSLVWLVRSFNFVSFNIRLCIFAITKENEMNLKMHFTCSFSGLPTTDDRRSIPVQIKLNFGNEIKLDLMMRLRAYRTKRVQRSTFECSCVTSTIGAHHSHSHLQVIKYSFSVYSAQNRSATHRHNRFEETKILNKIINPIFVCLLSQGVAHNQNLSIYRRK